MKLFMVAIPVLVVPMTMNFASALTFYWASSNLISLLQARMLKIPKIRKFLDIPPMIKHKNETVPGQKKQGIKGFFDGFRDTMDNFRSAGKVIDRREYDEQMFRDAGSAKTVKTYRYDPTKPMALKKKF